MFPTLHPFWQKINHACHLCHCWQDHVRRRITAMTTTTLVMILVLAAWTFLLVRMIRNDGSGRSTSAQQPPRSHEPDLFEKHYV